MAASLQLQLQVLLLLLILISFFISAASAVTITATDTSASPSFPPFPPLPQQDDHALYATVLSTLGYPQLAVATAAANLTTTTPVTIFAPSDSSLLTCPSCSLALLLQEHSVPGLYPLHYLRSLAFGTKLETLAPNRCLTVTNSFPASESPAAVGGDGGFGDGVVQEQKIFINGVEISSPDMFNNGLVMVHGLQGFVSHLSPLSCNIERMTSLSFPHPSSVSTAASSSVIRLMLKDAILRLRNNGYSFIALALRIKYNELSELKSITVFALDDASIFAGGEGFAYLSHFRFHIVPNRRMLAEELVTMPSATVLPTLEAGQRLVVTTAGGGGPASPMRINYVRITALNLLHNSRVAVHGVSLPFPHMHHHTMDAADEPFEQSEGSRCDPAWHSDTCDAPSTNANPPAGTGSTVDLQDDHGL